jgi:hypothetical protein
VLSLWLSRIDHAFPSSGRSGWYASHIIINLTSPHISLPALPEVGSPADSTTIPSSTGDGTTRRILKADKEDKKDKDDKKSDENIFGIGAPAETGRIYKEITDQFCTALTTCPTDVITKDVFLTSNLACTNSLTLSGARLVGNGFTIDMGTNSILLRNGAKLEDVDVTGTNVPVTFESGGSTVENVNIMGPPKTCLSIEGSDIDFKTVTIEQVTCRDFVEYGVYLDITDSGSLEELVISHVTFTSDTTFAVAINIEDAPTVTRIIVESVLTTGNHFSGLSVSSTATMGDIYVDNLTVEDCGGFGIIIGGEGVITTIGTLHVTNSNIFRCASYGMFFGAIGNLILENVFAKDNQAEGIYINAADTVVIKNSKALSNGFNGIELFGVNSVDMDDVLAARNGKGGIVLDTDGTVEFELTAAVFKDIVVLDNGTEDFFLLADSENTKVTIENLVACNTGNVGDSLVSIEVTKGVLDVKKDFVAASTGCSVRDRNNVPATCSVSPLTKKNFKTCAGFCGQ